MFVFPYFSFFALALAYPSVLDRRVASGSPVPEYVNGMWQVQDVGSFKYGQTFQFNGTDIPDGFIKDSGSIGSNVVSDPSLISVSDGFAQLLVPGGQDASAGPVNSAQIETTVSNIMYASVRTFAILTETEGVCNGMFMYKSNTQEIDIEWLSDPASKWDQGRKLWFTNQDQNGDGQTTNTSADNLPADATSVVHEYRSDWVPGKTTFYIDGQESWSATEDVPTEAGPWIWNNWANGNADWTAGPPATDAVFKIQQIQMYYNTTDEL